MDFVEIFIALAGAVVAVWLSLLVAAILWLGRRATRRAGREIEVVRRAARVRTLPALLDAMRSLAALSMLSAVALLIGPALLTLAPLLIAIGGFDLTAHMIHVHP